MDEQQALHEIGEALDSIFAGAAAPPQLRAAVLRRIQHRPVSRLPELLDWIGGVAILSILIVLIARLAPEPSGPLVLTILGCAIVIPSLAFALWSTRQTSP